MHHQDFILIFHGFILLLVYGSSASHQRRGLGAGISQVADFDCPEEFGYYPHPTDCTQYYVCVFGGALLESCTGGLMYSHELQTCDWPRNVGCGASENSDSGTVSTIRVTDPRTRAPQHSRAPVSQQQNTAAPQIARNANRQEYIRQRQPEVIQQQLYTEEDLGPAEEIESDRQQRVYRGQPSTIGQVQRDRDGLRTIKSGVHSQNVIPTGPDTQEKISVVSYSNQRQPRPQDQYRDNATLTGDVYALTDVTDSWSVDSGKNLTNRWKRQIPYRIGTYLPPKSAKIPIILIPGSSPVPEPDPKPVRFANPTHDPRQQGYYGVPVPGVILYRPVAYPREQNKTGSNLKKLTESTIQSDFRPVVYPVVTPAPQKTGVRYIEAAINPAKPIGQKIVVANVFYNYPNVTKTYRVETTTERVVAITSRKRTTETPVAIATTATSFNKHKAIVTEMPQDRRSTATTGKKVYHSRFNAAATTERIVAGHYKFVETPKGYQYRPTEKPRVTQPKPDYNDKKYYNYDYYDSEYYDDRRSNSREKANSSEVQYGSYESPKEYDYDSREIAKTQKPRDYDDYYEVTWRTTTNLTKNLFSPNKQNLYSPYQEATTTATTPAYRLNIPGDRVNMQTIQAISQGLNRPIRYRSTTTVRPTTEQFQIEAPRKKIPEEYYENFRPFPTKSLATVDDGRQRPHQPDGQRPQPVTTVTRAGTGVDQVQGFQVTSSLPPLTPTPRTIERYNTSQRYQPNQYDQYYTVYDEDADLYRGNDYPQQEYNTPSSTPSSNIVHQYRGQTTFKQQQQAIELEQQREPIQQRHQQPLRNSYNQDVYSPPPVVQDYNDQYSSQIDDQQYQHLVASTPKAPNRSVSTNSSKDTFPQSSITVSRISDNTTSKPETINRRSDSNSFFEPSAILIPPPRVAQGFQRPSPSTPKYSYTTEGYRTISPSTQRSAEPPRNGGALAKTLNNFDSLLTSFFSAVSGKQSSPPKSAPETIVRSEIGRIHHDPIIITDDYRNRETFKPEGITPPPPPSPNKNDYLAYFVEIEPKKAKTPEIVPSFVVAKPESVTDSPKIITKDALADGQSDVVNFNLRNRGRPFNSFVRIVPNGEEHQNIQLGASLDIEPILKPTTPQPPKIEPEVLPIRREPPRPAVVIPENPPTAEFRPQPPAEIPTERPRIRGNTFFRPRPAQELQPKLIENANPYKFVVVDAEKTVEKQPSSPAPFSRNPENEERNQFEVRNRFRFRTPDAVVPDREPKRFEIPTESNVIRTDEEESSETEDTSKEFEQEEPSEEVVQPEKIETSSTEPSTSTRKPFRIRVNPESDTEDSRSKSRRIVKIHRSELRNQRLNQQKYKRIRKPSTRAPTTSAEELTFNRENEIHSTYRPIIVLDSLSINKELAGGNVTGFAYSAEEPKDLSEATRSKLGLYPLANTSVVPVLDTIPRGFEKPKKPFFPPVELKPIIVPNREPSSSEKPLFLITSKPQTNRNVTVHENRATTTKPYVRGKFKPSDSSKIRFRPTTATPDSETTPGPHLSTRQPSYTIGSTGNEVTVNRGTPPSTNRGTRPTLKPSTAIVSKASEFIDIYRYPPRRPANLYATPTPDKSAAKCRKDVCLLPDCSCGGKDIPGGYSAEEIPQLVLLTFDDSVNDLNKGLYSELFERGRVNPNGCPISATFYVSHEWTDYSQVQNLYANGHEIASHSITHSFGEQFSQKKWTKEIAGQREILAAYGGVRLEDIRGMRAPFLAVGGNKMFKMLYDSNFTYDSSMPIYENRPPSWPYTLDYKLFHDCMIPPCPTKSYPGVWEVPMVMWQDLNGGRCSMGDACSNPPTADGVYKMLIKNFERHFTTNRAPFGLYYHAAWFTHEHHKEGFIAFLDTIVNMPEVWLVTTWQAIEWVRDPQPLSTVENFPPFQCNIEKAKKCNNPKVCNLWHKSGVRYMRTCQPCPDVYPWTGKTGVKNSRVDNEIIEE